MSTTIVFACKSNSCRSQLAEGWAHEWIKTQRLGLENRAKTRSFKGAGDDDRQLRGFLDGLLVVSVALDESSISNNGKQSSISSVDTPPSPTSRVTTNFGPSSTPAANRCVTCYGEMMCTSSSSTQRRRPKEKAIQAMAQDGVDISSYYAKSFTEVLPLIAHRRHNDVNKQQQLDLCINNWKRYLSFAGLCRVLSTASREMGMAYAGVVREEDDRGTSGSIIAVEGTADRKEPSPDKDETHQVVVDNLIVLCSCPDSLTRKLSELSKETLDWDIDPPTAAAKSEGDGAYLRVSRQIREKVDAFMNQLKGCTLMIDEDINRCNVELSEKNPEIYDDTALVAC